MRDPRGRVTQRVRTPRTPDRRLPIGGAARSGCGALAVRRAGSSALVCTTMRFPALPCDFGVTTRVRAYERRASCMRHPSPACTRPSNTQLPAPDHPALGLATIWDRHGRICARAARCGTVSVAGDSLCPMARSCTVRATTTVLQVWVVAGLGLAGGVMLVSRVGVTLHGPDPRLGGVSWNGLVRPRVGPASARAL